MHQRLKVDQDRLVAGRDDVLVVEIRRPERVQDGEQDSRPPEEPFSFRWPAERPAGDELLPAVPGPAQHSGRPQVAAGDPAAHPVCDLAKFEADPQVAWLVDKLATISEPDGRDRPAVAVPVSESQLNRHDRPWVRSVEHAADESLAIGGEPVQQLQAGLRPVQAERAE